MLNQNLRLSSLGSVRERDTLRLVASFKIVEKVTVQGHELGTVAHELEAVLVDEFVSCR